MPFIRTDDPTDGGDADDARPFAYAPTFFGAARTPFDPAALTGWAAAALAALRAIGATRFRVRYDGGHDEGYARPDAVELDGAWRPVDAARGPLGAAFATPGGRLASGIDTALVDLADAVAATLLGEHFGAGEFEMYGALALDLATLAVDDDPAAPPPTTDEEP